MTDLFPPHPVLSDIAPTEEDLLSLEEGYVEELGEEAGRVECARVVAQLAAEYQSAIENAKRDPLRGGWVPDEWRKMKGLLDSDDCDELWLFGGNRASKTSFSAWLVVQTLLENPGTFITCWSQNDKASKRVFQPAVYNYLPPELRKKRRDGVAKIVYSIANGFTDGTLILPNRSMIQFMTYNQFIQDPGVIEGYELGWKGDYGEKPAFTNLGNVFDEYLIGPELLETMRARLATRDAVNLIPFTPIHNYTETVRGILEGAQTIEHGEADEEDGYERIPLIQQPRKSNAKVFYLYTRSNKFNNYGRFCRDLEGKPKAFRFMKKYGIPHRLSMQKFPKFSTAVNVVAPERVPSQGITRYHVVDPAGDKNWFMLWVAVDADGAHWIYREWPDQETFGDWAEWRDGKWQPGDACRGFGYGYEAYAELFRELEGEEVIFERLIDPRMGASTKTGAQGATSIISEMEEYDIDFTPAIGLQESEGIQALQDLMDYDTGRPIDQLNQPRFYISSACGNLIRAMTSYDTPAGAVDLKHPWKDPIDCARYAAISGIDHMDPESLSSPMRGGAGY